MAVAGKTDSGFVRSRVFVRANRICAAAACGSDAETVTGTTAKAFVDSLVLTK